jgi:hypothetical protein
VENHKRQASSFKRFCKHYGLGYWDPAPSTVAYYITYLSSRFTSAASIRNYVSGIRFMHRQREMEAQALDSFIVTTTLRAVDLTLRTPVRRKLPISPRLLVDMCKLCECLGDIGVAFKVAITFAFYGMLRQSNIAPAAEQKFDPSRHTCRGDVILAPPGVVLLIKWSKTDQCFGSVPLVPLPHVPESPADPVQAYRDLLDLAPTVHPDQPLLTVPGRKAARIITTSQLTTALKEMLTALGKDAGLFSMRSFRRGGATSAYHAGVNCLAVKRHGNWRSDAFWAYVTAPHVTKSAVASALGQAIKHHSGK